MTSKLDIATRKGLFGLERVGQEWQVTQRNFLGDAVSLVHYDAHSDRLYATLELGHFGCKIQVSTDGGASFEEIACPKYPQKPDDEDADLDPTKQKPIPWDLKKVWSFASSKKRLWCGTIPGGLFYSEDQGSSWQLVESLWHHPKRKLWFGGGADFPGIHSILIDPRDEDHLTIGVSCGGVWTTRDAGASWELKAEGMRAEYMPPDQAYDQTIQDPHQLALCLEHPETIWCQHHNGIFLSRDDSESWQEIENVQPSAFGFAVAVHPQDPNTAWFVPAIKDEERYPRDGQLVVTRTKDGGKTFESLREGLPQQDAYDLIYRHALALGGDGQTLAMGSTTGGVWMSENSGDSWHSFSQNLPPIYALSFRD